MQEYSFPIIVNRYLEELQDRIQAKFSGVKDIAAAGLYQFKINNVGEYVFNR